MADIRGNLVQEAVYREFIGTFGQEGLIQLLIDRGQNPNSARDYARYMRNYWDRNEDTTIRSGATYFEDMFYLLIFKPPATPPTGDYSYGNGYTYICGRNLLETILELEPAFQELYRRTGRPFFEVLDYIHGIPMGVTVFVAIVENVLSAYIGESDTEIPDVGDLENG